jgi:TolA-binding protein
MKRFFWAVLLFFAATGPVVSQKIRIKDDPDELFYLATQLYREKEFPGCYRTLNTWFERSENRLLQEDARFLMASVCCELNTRDASVQLIRFINDFPLSDKLPRAYYLLGCTALNAEEYADALRFFERCPVSALNETEANAYRFRCAYASLQVKDFATARSLFAALAGVPNRYAPSATYFLAYMDYADGHIEQAREGFEKVSDQEQYRNVTDYFKLQLLYIDGNLDEMTHKADSMLQQKPTPEQKMELLRLLGAAWFEKKKHALSQQYYQEYLSMTTQLNRSDAYRIGINEYNQLEYASAIHYLSKVTGEADAIQQSAIYHMGLCYLKQNKKDQARMSFEQASNLSYDGPTREKALYNYALICYQNGYSPFNEQAKAFKRILTEFPNSEFSASVSNYLSEVLLSSKDYAGSLATLDSLPEWTPKMLQTKCRLLFLYGVEEYHAEHFAEAQQQLTKAAALALENGFPLNEILYWKGESNYRLGLLKEAAEDYKAFAQDPTSTKLKAYPLVAYQLGYAYFNQSLYSEARTWFEKYTASTAKKEKTGIDAQNRIGDCYFQAKDIAKAEKAYQQAQNNSSAGNDYATYQLAICQGARKQYRGKATLLETFEKKYPQSIFLDNALYELGMTQLQLKQTEAAKSAFETLLKQCSKSPLSGKAHLQLAELLKESGANDEAIASYKKVIELYPGTDDAQTALKGLKAIFVSNNTVSNYLNYTAGLRGIVHIETGEEDTLAIESAEKLQAAGSVTEAIEAYGFYLQHFPIGAFRDKAHFERGRLLMASGNTQEGLTDLDSLSARPGNTYQIPAVRLLAESCFAQKNYALSLNAYQQLETLAPDRTTRLSAIIGMVRCSYGLELYRSAIDAANRLINDENPGSDLQREALFYRALSLLKDGQADLAKADLLAVGEDSHTAFGAEARYRLAECLLSESKDKEAEKVVQEFLKEGTPQTYWLARASILQADICIKRGDTDEAKQYLTSLKQNYAVKNDIQDMIATRLNALTKRSNGL